MRFPCFFYSAIQINIFHFLFDYFPFFPSVLSLTDSSTYLFELSLTVVTLDVYSTTPVFVGVISRLFPILSYALKQKFYEYTLNNLDHLIRIPVQNQSCSYNGCTFITITMYNLSSILLLGSRSEGPIKSTDPLSPSCFLTAARLRF
ncbi:hypothetical protein K435DRAFT_401433 [Dendrothele bispora CBS 962.96]|uniref:Uncharacterized protein n=1 Tax=Dendrothele bispora (strain CBS 962.96) TaxID=1314807 RepID=A0A4S8MFH2_DENBC|nr:hypothetical protein K435DRAFT_401433 [Dendrothele bispora CBS 962.96]